MVKNFFEYIKELVPEKGSVFFTENNHSVYNAVSLYDIADLLSGQKIKFADYAIAYTWNAPAMWKYHFETMGLMVYKETSGEGPGIVGEKWIHFSKNAFFGAVCIVATRKGVTFDDEEHEMLRQAWARKLEHKETKEDREITDLENLESNFDSELFINKPGGKEDLSEEDREKIRTGEYFTKEEEEKRQKRYEEWVEQIKEKYYEKVLKISKEEAQEQERRAKEWFEQVQKRGGLTEVEIYG